MLTVFLPVTLNSVAFETLILPWQKKNASGEIEFKKLTRDQIKELDKKDEEQKTDMVDQYLDAYDSYREEQIKALEEGKVSIKEVQEISNQLLSLKNDQMSTIKKAMKAMGDELAALKEKGIDSNTDTFEASLKNAWDEKVSQIKGALNGEVPTVKMIIDTKATQTYGDITEGSDLWDVRPGIIDKPVRQPRIKSLFPNTPVTGEGLKFVEQDTVVRDAQNVAKCAAPTSNTKETLIVRSIETKMIKDVIKFCRTFVSDYPFMESRIRRLLTESVELKEDQDLLTADGLGENPFSIDFYASEFNAANPACNIAGEVSQATMIDLILGMRVQISVLGELNAFMPNVVLVNMCDWFTKVESRKDTQGNYIDSRVTMVNGMPNVGGMMVIPLANVPQGTLYVMDTNKGEILDRRRLELEIAFQNADEWEKEIASLKGYTRVNLWVPNEWKNAFMKCSDIDTAISAINKP